jgi:serine/threonine protein kinase
MLQRIGRYENLEWIATGGQGTVYRAWDPALDRVVAVKVINQSIKEDPDYLEALRREARLAAGLDHPFIITVYDFQVEDGIPYIVMEYVPDALDRHLQDGRRLPWERATEIVVQIARALQHAHNNGVVHRDIKPQNILLREDGVVVVSDYGIARASTSSTKFQPSSVMGTSAYMSPEQWASESLDGRMDQYALGIVFYEMLTGSTPFKGESIEAMYVQHRNTPLPALTSDLQVPGAIQQVIRKATEKSQDPRYASAGDSATTSPSVDERLVPNTGGLRCLSRLEG